MTAREEQREFAEAPDLFTVKGPGWTHVVTERYSLLLGPAPGFTGVQRPRMRAEEVEATVEEIRQIVRERGHRRPKWWVGELASPPDLGERLVALGLVPDEREPVLAAMALDREPAALPGVEARPAASLEEYAGGLEIEIGVFARDDREREEARAVVSDRYEAEHLSGRAPRFVAFVDGELVATAIAVRASRGLLLVGAATRADARGRGAYRALVRARWDLAVECGTAVLVVQAGVSSRPILERLGFETLSTIRNYVDPEAVSGA